MHTTSILAKIREEIQSSLDRAETRSRTMSGDAAIVAGGKALAYEDALRIIDAHVGADQ